jgi:hypothetical protein
MKKLHLISVNPGSYTKEKPIYTRLQGFNNALVELSETSISIKGKNNQTFFSHLQKVEEDFLTISYQGAYEDGTAFRLVMPGGTAKAILVARGEGESISFGDLTGDGYAVNFDLVDENQPDSAYNQESRDINADNPMESKAEILLATVDTFQHTNLELAKVNINRYLALLENNKIEFLKFSYVQNIIYGFGLAIRLKVINEQTANEKLSNLKYTFMSSDHLRYEQGIHVSGPHGGSRRVVEFAPNFEQKEGYLVTIYNQDGTHPFWGDNVQMATKRMKVTEKSNHVIKLQGFGTDPMGNSFRDYAMTIHLTDQDIDYAILHLMDRGIDIKYLS